MRQSLVAPALVPLAILLAGCTTADPLRSRSNAPMDPTAIVGAPAAEYDTPPRLASGRAPVYPIGRALDGESGSAEISYVVGVDGVPVDFEVLRADHPAFGDHAVIAVRAWRFEPARKDGQPIAVRMRQVFSFEPRR
jgi:TonB family protein